MGIFHQENKKENLILVFDIGSSSVGGVLFQKQISGIPKIIYSLREPIILRDQINIDQFLSLTLKSLDTIVNKIHSAGVGMPSKVFCVLSSPWYASQTRIINYTKNTPFVFNNKLADSLIEKEINLFEEEHLAQYMNTPNAIRTIELKNIKTMINGYESGEPLNKKGKELEMTIFISMSPEKILSKIEETIKHYFHVKEIVFSSFIMAFFTIIRDLYSHKENFLLVDIGGEVTDISMVKKNILRSSVSFPLGKNSIIRGVASVLNCTLEEARSAISLYKDGHADLATNSKLEPIINKLKNEWLQKFQESLPNLSNDISISASIYMAIDKDFTDFFSKIIKTEQFNQYTLTESKFEVTVLNTMMFQGMASFGEDVIRDPFLLIDSIYINRLLK